MSYHQLEDQVELCAKASAPNRIIPTGGNTIQSTTARINNFFIPFIHLVYMKCP